MPTIEELTTDLKGATVFSKVDLRSGYHQLILHPSCRYITCFSTHVGLFQYKRLNFGVSSAAEVFQHTIQSVIEDIPGAKNVSNDIIIFGRNQVEHDKALHTTLERLWKSGLTINPKKCHFNCPEVDFFGFRFTKNGITPDPSKVAELASIETPKNTSELMSFLGMAVYSARFIPDFATKSKPLRWLTRKDAAWSWTQEHSKAFNTIKRSHMKASINEYFDPREETVVYVDASSVGLATILTLNDKTITCALTPTEQRFSQTDRP
jgi:hypothetical protein